MFVTKHQIISFEETVVACKVLSLIILGSKHMTFPVYYHPLFKKKKQTKKKHIAPCAVFSVS